ncbi:TauD/TfdA family dioxygenase [Labrenzia sp. DG1229]|uniref:TauD/TfdA family dioxygenase n=1 Tax=Labrenzia sp. DG1229 TaxID=681847 RepID=UPI000691601B|nr:TauD/TfdA family dioxygenase [Labrenzia sp. DG1229]
MDVLQESQDEMYRTYELDSGGVIVLVIEATDCATSWQEQDVVDLYRKNRTSLEQHLLTHGAILFRGFPITNAIQLREFAAETSNGLWGYVNGNSPRKSISEGVYTATEFPAEYAISLHCELSYCTQWPARLYFGCPQPASIGGVAVFADARQIYDEMPRAILDEFDRRGGVKYTRVLPGTRGLGPTWQATFETTSMVDVEKHCQEHNYTLEHLPGNTIRVSNVTPATSIDPTSGRTVWFNQADQFHPSSNPPEDYEALMLLYKGKEDMLPQNVFFADGSPIPEETLKVIRETMASCKKTMPWVANDVLVLNNNILSHGREPFTPPRQLYVALTR